MDTLELAHTVVDAIADKMGDDILLLDLRGVSVFADYFVLGSGSSERQLRALHDGLEEVMRRQHNRKPLSVEGRPEHGWVLLDYGDIVVHLFSPEKRAFYNLEELWREAKTVVRIQ